MPFLDISIGNLDDALSDLSDFPALVEMMSKDAINKVAKGAKAEASRITRLKYALSEEDLDPFIRIGQLGNSPQGGASVRLMARPLPLSVFKPSVKMKSYRLQSSKGKSYTRKLPTIYVKRFVKGSEKQLKPYFPMHQRVNGALSSTDSAVRRVGNTKIGRVGTGDSSRLGYEGNKLTGVRFYTFPIAFLQKIRPKLVDYVGKQGSIELRSAFRIQFKGQRVLRGPR